MKSLVLLVALSIAVPCVAAEKPVSKKKPVPAKTVEPAAASGLISFRDPVTGELRPPTAEERARFIGRSRPASDDEAPSYTVIVRADGSKTAILRNAMSYTVVRKRADGTVEQGCFQDPASAEAFRKGASPAPSVEQ